VVLTVSPQKTIGTLESMIIECAFLVMVKTMRSATLFLC